MLTMQFNTSGAAFDDLPATETGQILREIADRIESGETEGTVRDFNGNTIGRYDLCED